MGDDSVCCYVQELCHKQGIVQVGHRIPPSHSCEMTQNPRVSPFRRNLTSHTLCSSCTSGGIQRGNLRCESWLSSSPIRWRIASKHTTCVSTGCCGKVPYRHVWTFEMRTGVPLPTPTTVEMSMYMYSICFSLEHSILTEIMKTTTGWWIFGYESLRRRRVTSSSTCTLLTSSTAIPRLAIMACKCSEKGRAFTMFISLMLRS